MFFVLLPACGPLSTKRMSRESEIEVEAVQAAVRGGHGAQHDEKTGHEAAAETTPSGPQSLSDEPIRPLREKFDVEPEKVALGKRLYFDKKISGDGTIACATCHDLNKGGADARDISIGIRGQKGDINSPTVLNSALNFVQFWDGRAKDLEEQAQGPVVNPAEMGSDWKKVIAYLKSDKTYEAAFTKLYSDGVTQTNFAHAVAEYERTLLTPSRFDAYLKGDKAAITDEEKQGYAAFKAVGCTTCHFGENVGGSMYQKMGLIKDYFSDRAKTKPLTETDNGRFNVTKNESDRYFFKVPTLRNVELTAPYLHDASQKTLEDTVKVMAKYQLGKDISETETSSIVAFLKSLTGTLPAGAKL